LQLISSGDDEAGVACAGHEAPDPVEVLEDPEEEEGHDVVEVLHDEEALEEEAQADEVGLGVAAHGEGRVVVEGYASSCSFLLILLCATKVCV
jgi:hypothetical protein